MNDDKFRILVKLLALIIRAILWRGVEYSGEFDSKLKKIEGEVLIWDGTIKD